MLGSSFEEGLRNLDAAAGATRSLAS
jgi:hypothetical protein